MDDAEPILSVRHLVTGFDGAESAPHPVNDVSFEVKHGSVLGVVGESGSGKSLTALSIARLLPSNARTLGGEVIFQGRDLLQLSEQQMQGVRGRQIGFIFQEPATALSPVHTVNWQMAMALRALGEAPPKGVFERRRAGRARAVELLRQVELADPERVLDAYPHQLSAGMRRRVLIAMALAGNPTLLIADAPTTGLDAAIQAQILELFTRLTRERAMSAIFITHDLGVLAEIATDVVVMRNGQVVETGPVRGLISEPRHPYTLALINSIPGHQSRLPT
jgi:ABC-type dipeptide/oligopeptide/nickel transport system ATPase component